MDNKLKFLNQIYSDCLYQSTLKVCSENKEKNIFIVPFEESCINFDEYAGYMQTKDSVLMNLCGYDQPESEKRFTYSLNTADSLIKYNDSFYFIEFKDEKTKRVNSIFSKIIGSLSILNIIYYQAGNIQLKDNSKFPINKFIVVYSGRSSQNIEENDSINTPSSVQQKFEQNASEKEYPVPTPEDPPWLKKLNIETNALFSFPVKVIYANSISSYEEIFQ